MQIRWIALIAAAVAAYLSVVTAGYERGDEKLVVFYGQMLAANFAGAQRSIDEAVKISPDNARYHAWRGYCLSQSLPPQCPRRSALSAEQLRTVEAAAAEYRATLRLNDRDAVAHHDLAWLAHLAGDDSKARREWQRAVEIDPDNAVLHLSLGMFLEETGDAKNGAAQFAVAVQLSPAVLDSPFFTRHPALARTIVQRCVAEIEGRLAHGNDPVMKARLGKFYLYAGDLDRSAQALQDAARELPNLPLVWFNLGEVRRLQGDETQAIAHYERARFLDSRLPGPHLRIGEIGQQVEELRLAGQRWARMNPITAAHNNRLYHGVSQQIDDLLPTTLVWYLSPCEASNAYSNLARLVPRNRTYRERSRACEEIPEPHAS